VRGLEQNERVMRGVGDSATAADWIEKVWYSKRGQDVLAVGARILSGQGVRFPRDDDREVRLD
jgi:hypothetical protein